MKINKIVKGTVLVSGLSAVLLMSSCSNVQPVSVGNTDLTQTAATRPATPTNYAVTLDQNYSTIRITFSSNLKNVTGFWLERGFDGKSWPSQDHYLSPISPYLYLDYEIARDVKYYYRVCASNNGTNSAWTSAKAFNLLTNDILSATYVLLSKGLDLQWTVTKSSNFYVERSTNSGASYSKLSGTISKSGTYWHIADPNFKTGQGEIFRYRVRVQKASDAYCEWTYVHPID